MDAIFRACKASQSASTLPFEEMVKQDLRPLKAVIPAFLGKIKNEAASIFLILILYLIYRPLDAPFRACEASQSASALPFEETVKQDLRPLKAVIPAFLGKIKNEAASIFLVLILYLLSQLLDTLFRACEASQSVSTLPFEETAKKDLRPLKAVIWAFTARQKRSHFRFESS